MIDYNEPYLIQNINKFEDERGIFYQSYNKNIFNKNFIVDNHSISKKNVVKGLHYQWDKPLDKLIRISRGSILDIIVDIRPNSAHFTKVYYYTLSEYNLNQLWIPKGFAHGFCVLSEEVHIQYKFTEEYNKDGENGINIFDEILDIKLPIAKKDVIMSNKDINLMSLLEYKNKPKFMDLS